jgi:hypothetical protein
MSHVFITKIAMRAGGMAQVVEHLPTKSKAEFNSSTAQIAMTLLPSTGDAGC